MEFSGQLIAGKYRLDKKIGAGSFGLVYSATEITTGIEMAAKLEPKGSRRQLLGDEAKAMQSLRRGEGFPKVFWYGAEFDYNIIVMQRLGPSLEHLLISCNHLFSVKTTVQLALQLIDRIEYMHRHSYIHRDIKPDNFLVDVEYQTHVYAIDFGLSKKYRDPSSHQHIPYRENKSLTGTARYVSLMTHMGIEQSRRDDIESIGYMLVYFLKGRLPWQGAVGNNKLEKYTKIMECKMSTRVEALCKGLPNEFVVFLHYAKALKFEEQPNYSYLKELFLGLASREGIAVDDRFDWNIPLLTSSDMTDSMQPPVAKHRKNKRRCASPVSDLKQPPNTMSSQLCVVASDDDTDIILHGPCIRDREDFNRKVDNWLKVCNSYCRVS